MYSRIVGTGSHLPERVLTNADLEKMVDTSDEWIRERTGIERRHIPAPGETTVDLARMVDTRLAENQTDGWHYDTMPRDSQAWRASLEAINEDAHEHFGDDFAECTLDQQRELLEAVRTWGDDRWHGLPPAQVWSLWTRYAATAFYSHPAVWNEIGFGGPAYPRGYKNLGVDKREPFEVADARPHDDPLRRPGEERDKRSTQHATGSAGDNVTHASSDDPEGGS
jgi:hypothetical protein